MHGCVGDGVCNIVWDGVCDVVCDVMCNVVCNVVCNDVCDDVGVGVSGVEGSGKVDLSILCCLGVWVVDRQADGWTDR